MKKTFYFFFLLILGFLSISCSDETHVVSAAADGKELEEGTNVPFYLQQNYPNPFNGTTNIYFGVAKNMHVTLKVYTEDYVLVTTIIDKELLSMHHYYATFNARDNEGNLLPSGDYYYTLEGEGLILTRKMKILK